MRDFYPEDMMLREKIFNAWKTAARRYGFEQYDSCVVESLDILKRKGGEEIVRQIYAFQDKSGRDLALRPEMTPTLARMLSARRNALAFPIKWFCIAQCFRYERMTKGRKREHYQWNLDIAGEESVCAEAETLATAACALGLLGIDKTEVAIHVSSRALLSDLLEKLQIDRAHHAAIYLAIDKRGKIPDEEITALLKENGIPDGDAGRIFDLIRIPTLEAAVEYLGGATPSSDRLVELFSTLSRYGIADMVKFDISVVRGLNYYTGIVFEAYDAAQSSRAIFGGGRYDNLLQDIGGEAMTAVGMGFGDVVIADLLAAKSGMAIKSDSRTAIGCMEEGQMPAAIATAEFFRQQGKEVDMALRPLKPKAFFARAGNGDFTEAVYIGPDEVAKGILRVKNLLERTERQMPLPTCDR